MHTRPYRPKQASGMGDGVLVRDCHERRECISNLQMCQIHGQVGR